jgi:thiamine-monophosphate kinase
VSRAGPGRNFALGPGAEFDRIRRIIAELGERASGLGDDCALLPVGDEFLALSTDVSVEGVHFRLDWISLEEAGWRAAAAALSDLAAEGAEPLGLLSAVTAPRGSGESELLQLMGGIGRAAEYAGAPVIGGDLSSGSEWSVAVTVVGQTRQPVTRKGARPGDGIWVTGALGGSRAALEAWRRGDSSSEAARRRYARPEPRIAAGRWLAEHGARAMLDLSDGLGGDAAHLAAASGVGIEIDLDLVPVAPEAEEAARHSGRPAEEFAAAGGEDFELLVALPPDFAGAGEFIQACGIPLTRIGTAESGSGARFLRAGRRVELEGYSHFG